MLLPLTTSRLSSSDRSVDIFDSKNLEAPWLSLHVGQVPNLVCNFYFILPQTTPSRSLQGRMLAESESQRQTDSSDVLQ